MLEYLDSNVVQIAIYRFVSLGHGVARVQMCWLQSIIK